jgi:sigma-B regulation protein RsbU (phosphoserine phosphatase)
VPCREVGGDFFNYFPLPSGELALLVGDVSGKGISAALLMANIQATLRARLPLGGSLANLVDAIDHDVHENTPPEVYLTLFVGVLDRSGRTLRYVNAGHNPQFVRRADGTLEQMHATGLPVGLLPGRGYEQQSVDLGGSDLLFFYTDGTVEIVNESGEFFGYERLAEVIGRNRALGVEEILAEVEAELRRFRGTVEPADDATMMAVRLAPAAAAMPEPAATPAPAA